jgi:hypothetical protein
MQGHDAASDWANVIVATRKCFCFSGSDLGPCLPANVQRLGSALGRFMTLTRLSKIGMADQNDLSS